MWPHIHPAVFLLFLNPPFCHPFTLFKFPSRSAIPLQHILRSNSQTFEDASDNVEYTAFIGSDVSLTGSYNFDKGLKISGSFSGTLTAPPTSSTLTVTSSGSCVSEVANLDTLNCDGILCGNIRVRHVHLGSSARVVGDVVCETMVVEEGASLLGVMRVGQEEDILREAGKIKEGIEDSLPRAQSQAPSQVQSFNRFAPPSYTTTFYPPSSSGASQPPPASSQNPYSYNSNNINNNSGLNLNVDNFGNPLFRAPTNSQVDTLRKNRDKVKDARELMDSKMGTSKKFAVNRDFMNKIDADKPYDWRETLDKTNQILKRGTPAAKKEDVFRTKNKQEEDEDESTRKFLGRFRGNN